MIRKFSVMFLILLLSSMMVVAGPNTVPATVQPSNTNINVAQQAADTAPALQNDFIVSTTSSLDKKLLQSQGCTITHELNEETSVSCPEGVVPKNARPDRLFQLLDLEADVQIDADDVWSLGYDGSGVTVAVLDTGIDTDHPDLVDSILSCESHVPGEDCEDFHGHGSHVAGIITGNGIDGNAKGVAPGANVRMYKVCRPEGCYESDMISAMEAAVLTEAKVMSISIGGGNYDGENCNSDSLAKKVNWVASHGITVAIASGNDRFLVSSPACASEAIATGAVDKNDNVASFSNFGPSLDIVAPGVSIYSCVIGGYDSWSGTSMATPHVAAVAALMLEANPTLTTDDIKNALYSSASPINPDSTCYGVTRKRGPSYWIGQVSCSDDNYGAGVVNALGAVNAVLPSNTVCGNNIVELGEQCDDGNTADGDGCSAACTIEVADPVCGNGIVEAGEQCDDGNTANGDGCSSTCQTESTGACVPVEGGLCNCNGKCGGKETALTCPADCS